MAARLELQAGRDRVAAATGVPARTVSRILVRHGLPPICALDPVTGVVIRAGRASTTRYERAEPGNLVHVDVEKTGRIPDGGGWRALGRESTAGPKRRAARIGFDYVHAAVDDHSRLAYAEIHPDEKGDTAAGFLARTAAFFASHGIAVREVITDNAWSYRHSRAFRDTVAAVGAGGAPAVHQAPLSLAEREGGEVQPHPGNQMGLPPAVHQQRPAHPSPGAMARALQH